MGPCHDRGCFNWYVGAIYGGTIRSSAVDHDERIPLFTRTAESDPDMPYVPLLRYALRRRRVLALTQITAHLKRKTSLCI